MLAKRWVQWLAVLVIIALFGGGVGALLIAQEWHVAGVSVLTVTAIILHLCFAGRIFAQVQARWVLWLVIYEGIQILAILIAVPFFLAGSDDMALLLVGVSVTTRLVVIARACAAEPRLRIPAILVLGGGDIAGFCSVSSVMGFPGTVVAITGIAGISILFIVGLWLIRAALSGPRPVFGVARTLVDEAIRMKIALIFIVVLIITVPLLAVLLGGSMRLQYQIQAFLSWSLTATAVLMGFMTIFLSCATICSEIDRHQIYLTVTKPVSRAEYLAGKWLGITLLNLLLLLVLCGGIYSFARVLQATGTARDADDWAAVKWQVLTARRTIQPSLAPGAYENMKYMGQTVKEVRLREQRKPLAERLTKRQWGQIRQAIMTRWYTVSHRNSQGYVFRDMHAIREAAIEARGLRERAQVALLESLALTAADADEAARFRGWAADLANANQMRAESQRLRAAAQGAEDRDAADRMQENSNKLVVEAGRLWQQGITAAGPYLGDLRNPSPQEVLQLRFKPQVSERPKEERVLLAFQMNGRPYPTDTNEPIHAFSRDNFHVINVPAVWIDHRGTLVLQIANVTEADQSRPDGSTGGVTISFAPGEGLEIMVAAGSFEGNLIRSVLIIWAGLCFLAMQGLAAGTFLGFPVACMLSLLVFVTTVLSGYVDESIFYYGQFPDNYESPLDLAGVIWSRFAENVGSGKLWDAAKIPIGLIGKTFVTVVPSFSKHDPIPLLTDGRLVSMARLIAAWFWVGLISTTLCWTVAWLVFRRRELGRVMV